MRPIRLRAPSGDGALLASPPLDQCPLATRANAARLNQWDHDFQGRRANRLRAMARAQAIAAARRFHDRYGLPVPEAPDRPDLLVVTGHQPELFHPGVWVKNFALAGLAAGTGAAGLNLIVDNDIPKGSSIRVPQLDGGKLRARPVDFDVRADEAPFEDRKVQDEDLFTSFADRVADTMVGGADGTLLREYWARVIARRDAGGSSDRAGLRFALARHEQEEAWGVRNFELPIGALCETEAFHWFASHLLANLPRFQGIHNAALARYRSTYGIRSRNHPVPALARQGEWLEAPFWVWRVQAARRRPLMIRQLARTMELRVGGEDEPFATLPLAPDREACCAIEVLQGLPGQGIRLRTRALTTTMYSRFLLGDLFVHGIGGAKYDELGDEVAREFFAIEPPTFLTLSQTVRVGLDRAPVSREDEQRLHRKLRDLEHNPDRHLAEPRPADARPLVESKWVAIEGPIATRRDRVRRLHTIRRSNQGLSAWVEAEMAETRRELERVAEGLRHNAVADSREYAFPLHQEDRLRAALERTRGQAAGG